MRIPVTLAVVLAAAAPVDAQWTMQKSGTTAEFRGLHAVNDRVVWAAGKGGVVARTTNGGDSWTSDTIPGAGGLFLIAVRAVDQRRAWVVGTAFTGASLARIYRTDDGGRTWRMQFESALPGVFLDGLAFWDATHGIAFGDPLDGRFFILTTSNGGAHWQRVDPERLPRTLPGEAAFAASGTAIALKGSSHVWIATGGGARSRVMHSPNRGGNWEVFDTPVSGAQAKGLFGLAFVDEGRGVAVGGNYQQPESSLENLLRTEDGGRTWTARTSPALVGVQYGVVRAGTSVFLAAGPGGSALSTDRGLTWRRLEGPGFNTVSCAGASCWGAGVDGRIGRLRPVR